MGKVLDWADVQGVDLEAQRLSSSLPKVSSRQYVSLACGECVCVCRGVVRFLRDAPLDSRTHTLAGRVNRFLKVVGRGAVVELVAVS